jgi:hypothetical protein
MDTAAVPELGAVPRSLTQLAVEPNVHAHPASARTNTTYDPPLPPAVMLYTLVRTEPGWKFATTLTGCVIVTLVEAGVPAGRPVQPEKQAPAFGTARSPTTVEAG